LIITPFGVKQEKDNINYNKYIILIFELARQAAYLFFELQEFFLIKFQQTRFHDDIHFARIYETNSHIRGKCNYQFIHSSC
jgi:hypothetical protein